MFVLQMYDFSAILQAKKRFFLTLVFCIGIGYSQYLIYVYVPGRKQSSLAKRIKRCVSRLWQNGVLLK